LITFVDVSATKAISRISSQAFADVVAGAVRTRGVIVTVVQIHETFVNVTTGDAISTVSSIAFASVGTNSVGTSGMSMTLGGDIAFVYVAAGEPVARISFVALTRV